MKKYKRMNVGLVEQGIFRWPEGLEEWRNYRIEYGGHAEWCKYEGSIWLPPTVDPQLIEDILSDKNNAS